MELKQDNLKKENSKLEDTIEEVYKENQKVIKEMERIKNDLAEIEKQKKEEKLFLAN